MADEDGGGIVSHSEAIGFVVGFVVIVVILAEFYRRVSSFWGEAELSVMSVSNNFSSFFVEIFPFVQFVSILLSGLLVLVLIFVLKKTSSVVAESKYKIEQAEQEYSNRRNKGVVNQKWDRVIYHLDSQNPNDWKVAIMEADIILDELLESMGHSGETISAKLKQIEKSDFNTLDQAWEAHKVRNKIAHESGEYVLSEREARRVIDMYRSVFEEFRVI